MLFEARKRSAVIATIHLVMFNLADLLETTEQVMPRALPTNCFFILFAFLEKIEKRERKKREGKKREERKDYKFP